MEKLKEFNNLAARKADQGVASQLPRIWKVSKATPVPAEETTMGNKAWREEGMGGMNSRMFWSLPWPSRMS